MTFHFLNYEININFKNLRKIYLRNINVSDLSKNVRECTRKIFINKLTINSMFEKYFNFFGVLK